MCKKTLRVVSIIMILAMLFTCTVYAYETGIKAAPKLSMSVTGSTATCTAKITASGKTINATLTLKQGSTVIASWSGTGTGILTLSGTATVVSGLTYTLTVSGTIDGVAFTPV